MQTIWTRYKWWLISASALIVLLIGIFAGWKIAVAILGAAGAAGAAMTSREAEHSAKVSDAIEERQRKRREEAERLRGGRW